LVVSVLERVAAAALNVPVKVGDADRTIEPVPVVVPSAGAASDRMKVVTIPLTAAVAEVAVGLAAMAGGEGGIGGAPAHAGVAMSMAQSQVGMCLMLSSPSL